jgi:Putative endonuclease, protein of unknown function (DUF1780)
MSAMNDNDEKYLKDLRAHTSETRTLLSNAQKPERERMTVRAFLRCIGIEFADPEVRASVEEPVDVFFRSARFQVREVLGGRKRGDEWKDRERRYRDAQRMSDLLETYRPSEPMSLGEASHEVAEALTEKAARYGVPGCAMLDALVYLDLTGRHLWPLEPAQNANIASELERHGWRSVSFVFLPYGVVLTAKSSAPVFFKDKVGLVLKEWTNPDGWFDP